MRSKNTFNNVAVLKGGPSSERSVSLKSGSAVAKGLRESGYSVSEIDVTERSVNLPAGIEAVFIALHGEFGEDGEVQRILESRRIPYTGSGPKASAASFDKRIAKRILAENKILTPEYEVLKRGMTPRIGLPAVVKPARQGSSIGVYRVFAEKDWKPALDGAFAYDDELIVEKYIKGRELTAGVVGKEVFPVVEIVAPDDWYNYDAKYTGGRTEYLVPAPVSVETAARCSAAAAGTFSALGCRGMGRVDFRLAEDGKAYVLELNNIPGFTETSLLPKAALAAGITFARLCDRIMKSATLGG